VAGAVSRGRSLVPGAAPPPDGAAPPDARARRTVAKSDDFPSPTDAGCQVGDYLLAAARADGGRLAVVCGTIELSYAAFAERALRLAAALAARGVAPGDRVAYLGPNCHALLEAYFGVPWAGAVLVPLHARLTRPELAALLRDAAPTALLVDTAWVRRLPAEALAAIPVRVVVGANGGDGWLDYEALVAGQGTAPEAPVVDRDGSRVRDGMTTEQGVAEMFYTSGSTGQPRAAMLTGGNLIANAAGVREALELGPDDMVLHALSLFHANGWGFPHAAVMAGATQVVLRKFVPRATLELAAARRTTVTYVVPTMARALVETRGPTSRELALRWLVVGGAASTPELAAAAEARLGATFVGSYGLTETSPVLTLATLLPEMHEWPREARLRQQAAAGRPTAGACLRVVDAVGRSVPADGAATGEVQVAGPLVMAGYWQRPAETVAAFTPDGWLRTGDLATVDRWGYLRIVARQKELIDCGGDKVAPAEIERVLAAHPAVREAAVVPVPHVRWGQAPAALVVLRPGATADPTTLRRHCARHLAAFKVPRAIHVVARLPHTATGKLARARLRLPRPSGR